MAKTLESTSGRRAQLSSLRGQTTVIFYESRGHENANETLKLACGRLVDAGTPGLQVLGVANLNGLRFVRGVVRPTVKAIARRYDTEIWMDFDGVLLNAELGLADQDANVLVLDPEGRVAFCAQGALDETRTEIFSEALAASLGVDPRGEDRPAAAVG